MNISNLKIAITEDEAFIALNIKRQLERMGYNVSGLFVTGDSLLEYLVNDTPDIILMDICLEGDKDGIETSALVQEKYDIPVVFITALSDAETFERIKKNNPYGYITKPLNFSKMSYVIELAYSKHKMDMEVRRSERRYRNLYSKMFNGICVFELNLKTGGYVAIEYNVALATILSVDMQFLKDKSLTDIFPKSAHYLEAVLEQVVHTGEPQLIEKYFPEIDRYLSIKIFINMENQVAFLIDDISDQKKYQDSLYLASIGRISTAITHEINQPLQSIKVLADSILYLHESGEQVKYEELISDFKEVADRVVRIEKIINNTKCLQKNPKVNDFSEVDINTCIQNAIENYSKKLESLGVQLIMELGDNLPKIIATESILDQIFSNLMNNAVTALTSGNNGGEKIVKICTLKDNGFVKFLFSDNGPGVSEENEYSIFQPHVTTGHSEENMGMGLYIVRCLLNQINGNISYRHADPVGALFLLRFPIKNNGA